MKLHWQAIAIAKSLVEFNAVAVGNLVLIPRGYGVTDEAIADAAGLDEELVETYRHNKNYFLIEIPEDI